MISLCSVPSHNHCTNIRSMGNGLQPIHLALIPETGHETRMRKARSEKNQCQRRIQMHYREMLDLAPAYKDQYSCRSCFPFCNHSVSLIEDALLLKYEEVLTVNNQQQQTLVSTDAMLKEILASPIYPACYIWAFEFSSSDVSIALEPTMLWRLGMVRDFSSVDQLQRMSISIESHDRLMRKTFSLYQRVCDNRMQSVGNCNDTTTMCLKDSDTSKEIKELSYSSLLSSDCIGYFYSRQHVWERSFDEALDVDSTRCDSIDHAGMLSLKTCTLVISQWNVTPNLLTAREIAQERTVSVKSDQELLIFKNVDLIMGNEAEKHEVFVTSEREALFQQLFSDVASMNISSLPVGLEDCDISLIESCLALNGSLIDSHAKKSLSAASMVKKTIDYLPISSRQGLIGGQISVRKLNVAVNNLLEIRSSKQSISIKAVCCSAIVEREKTNDIGNHRVFETAAASVKWLLPMISSKQGLDYGRSKLLKDASEFFSLGNGSNEDSQERWSLETVAKLAKPTLVEIETRKRPLSEFLSEQSPAPPLPPLLTAVTPTTKPMNHPISSTLQSIMKKRNVCFSLSVDSHAESFHEEHRTEMCVQEAVTEVFTKSDDQRPSNQMLVNHGENEKSLSILPSKVMHNADELRGKGDSANFRADEHHVPHSPLKRRCVGPMDKFLLPASGLMRNKSSTLSEATPQTVNVKLSSLSNEISCSESFHNKAKDTSSITTVKHPPILEGFKILVAERFFEDHAVAVAELNSNHGVISLDAFIVDPVDVIVSAECGVITVSESILQNQSSLVEKIKSILQLTLKFSKLWVIVMSDPIRRGDLNTLNAMKSKLSISLCRCGSTITIRDCLGSNENDMARLIQQVCLTEYQCSIASGANTQQLVERPYLDLLQDPTFLAHCDFLQRFPTINLFVAAMMLSQWTLKELITISPIDAGAYLMKLFPHIVNPKNMQPRIFKFSDLLQIQK